MYTFIDIFAFKSLNTILYANEGPFQECHGGQHFIHKNDIRVHGPIMPFQQYK